MHPVRDIYAAEQKLVDDRKAMREKIRQREAEEEAAKLKAQEKSQPDEVAQEVGKPATSGVDSKKEEVTSEDQLEDYGEEALSNEQKAESQKGSEHEREGQ